MTIEKRAGQYLRVSLDRDGRSRSVDEQQVENERAATAEGWQMVITHADPNRSASRYATRARERYLQLLDDIDQRRLDILILWEPSRGSRRVSEWVELIETCEARHVLIHVTSHGRTYDPARPRDRRSLLEDAVDSEYESGKTSERMKRTTAAAAEAGRPFGTLPYGFAREYEVGSRSPVRQVPDEALTAPIVREIVARVLAGDGLHKIAVDLNRRRVPTPQQVRDLRTGTTDRARGGWNNPKLRKLLSSYSMAGLRIHQGRIVGEALWEPIVSVADHAAALAIINDPARRTQRGTAPKYLLSGIATCAAVVDGEVCGAWLRHFPNGGFPSYGCAGRAGTNDGHVVRRAKPLEALVTVAVLKALTDPGWARAISGHLSEGKADADAAQREVADLEAALTEFQETAMSARGEALRRAWSVVEDYSQRIEAARERRDRTSPLPRVVLDMAGPDAGAGWVAADLAEQRLVVRALLTVEVGRSTQPRGRRGFDESTVAISRRR